MTMKQAKVWELLENAPHYVTNVSQLISWSYNYDYQTGMPLWAFLDLIGYTRENFGGNLNPEGYTIDYISAECFAGALNEWADRPQDVEDFIQQYYAADE